jgi:hypothetical protein
MKERSRRGGQSTRSVNREMRGPAEVVAPAGEDDISYAVPEGSIVIFARAAFPDTPLPRLNCAPPNTAPPEPSHHRAGTGNAIPGSGRGNTAAGESHHLINQNLFRALGHQKPSLAADRSCAYSLSMHHFERDGS